jgi:pyrimidine-specific ribonucleoside hydrolase
MRACEVAALALICVLGIGGCGSGPGEPRTVARTPVVVDTDLGPDDTLALLYLVSRPDLDVRAVAVSGTGLVRCPAGAQRAQEVLAAAGRDDIPVACGRDRPLAGFNAFPPEWRDPADDLYGLPLPPATGHPEPGGAVDLLERAISSSRDVELVALGPLTNVAELLREHPKGLAGIHAMAGTIDAPGNVGPGHEGAEYNLWVDPAAADEVLRSDVPVTLVPLDATNSVPATVVFALALQRYHYARPAASLAWELMDLNRMHAGGRYFWDPLAAAALAAPNVVRLRTERLRATRDGRLIRDRSRRAVRVAVAADRARFERELLGTLAGSARVTIPDADVGAAITCEAAQCAYRGPDAVPASGEGAFDTINRSDAEMTHVLGRLSDGRTVDDLRRLVRPDRPFEPPLWFSRVATGATPPRSRMTWLVTVESGDYAIVVSGPGGTRVLAGIRAG